MKILVCVLLCLPAVAAGDLYSRWTGIQLGDDCPLIATVENRLGFTLSRTGGSESPQVYRGMHGGREVVVIYGCQQDRLEEQTIVLQSSGEGDAHRLAAEQTRVLVGLMGKPLHNGLSLSFWKRFFLGFKGGDLDYLTRVVVWGRANDDTMLELLETRGDQWQIRISRGHSKALFLLNL